MVTRDYDYLEDESYKDCIESQKRGDLYAREDWELNDYILEGSERNVEKCLGRKISPFKSGRSHGVLKNKKIHRIQHRKQKRIFVKSHV